MKETLDKSVVHTMPLVLSDNVSNVRRSTNTAITNFKKFCKVNKFLHNHGILFFLQIGT